MNVGDTVYIVKQNGYSKPSFITSKVDKIGRKYFYAYGMNFDKITYKHIEPNYTQFNAMAYLSEDEYYKEALNRYIKMKVKDTINGYNVTTEQYNRIAEILEIKKPTAEELGICFE